MAQMFHGYKQRKNITDHHKKNIEMASAYTMLQHETVSLLFNLINVNVNVIVVFNANVLRLDEGRRQRRSETSIWT